MELSRRSLIKALGLSPIAANAIGQHLETIASTGVYGLLADDQIEVPCEATSSEAENFTSVASWWRKRGKGEILERARSIHGFDADIFSLRLPLQFKVHMQRGRNFERLKARRWSEVEQILRRNGVFKWWL